YYIVIERGYQEFEEAEGAVTTKVSGIVEANGSIFGKVNREIWDFADYVPVQENSAVFIMTNVLVTPNQTEGVCEEDPTIEDARCENRTCVAGQPVMWGNGIKTGKCVNSTREPGAKVCEIEAWCPVERDDNTTQRNIPDELSYDYLWRCRYNEKDKWDKFCPTFTLDTIVRLSGYSFHQIARQGAVIEMTITWDCNLDKTRQCLPTYTFSRLDRKEHKIFRGYFFRFAEHYGDDGKSKRTLYKATGLYVVINIQGRAGKFSPTTFLVQIGGYIGLLAIVPVVLDLIIDYLPTRCVKYREEIRKRKYVHVPGTADSERQPLLPFCLMGMICGFYSGRLSVITAQQIPRLKFPDAVTQTQWLLVHSTLGILLFLLWTERAILKSTCTRSILLYDLDLRM
ncbi:hypothetical protein BaRGS_00010858, partial [Batillaria attramentaria]